MNKHKWKRIYIVKVGIIFWQINSFICLSQLQFFWLIIQKLKIAEFGLDRLN